MKFLDRKPRPDRFEWYALATALFLVLLLSGLRAWEVYFA